jgi:riboflavin synthase
MFTGLVEAVGRLSGRDEHAGGLRWWIETGALNMADAQVGESIAVSGVCLTAVAFGSNAFAAVLSEETLRRSSLGAKPVGAPLNLERSLRAGDRLGGHLVAGHVDGVGRIRRIMPEGASQRWWFDAPAALLRYIAVKGSICVDGVSLTVTDVDGTGFAVALIPHTIEATAFRSSAVEGTVNLEVDLIARYVERLLAARATDGPAHGSEAE